MVGCGSDAVGVKSCAAYRSLCGVIVLSSVGPMVVYYGEGGPWR